MMGSRDARTRNGARDKHGQTGYVHVSRSGASSQMMAADAVRQGLRGSAGFPYHFHGHDRWPPRSKCSVLHDPPPPATVNKSNICHRHYRRCRAKSVALPLPRHMPFVPCHPSTFREHQCTAATLQRLHIRYNSDVLLLK